MSSWIKSINTLALKKIVICSPCTCSDTFGNSDTGLFNANFGGVTHGGSVANISKNTIQKRINNAVPKKKPKNLEKTGGIFFLLTNIQGCSLGCRQNFLSNTKEYIFKLLQKIVNKLHSIYVKNIWILIKNVQFFYQIL